MRGCFALLLAGQCFAVHRQVPTITPTLLDVNAEHKSGPRENVIDGSVDNHWNAGHVDGWDVPNWASFDFVAPQRVTGFSFYSYGDVTHDVKDWELQVSETGTDGWTTVASGVGVSGTDEKQTVNFDGAVSQFWRFYIPTRHSRYQAWVREVSFATFPLSGTSISSEPETYVPLSTAPMAENGILSPILLDVNAEHRSGPYDNVIDGSVDNYWNAGHVDGWDVPNWASFYFVAPQRVTGFSFYSYGDVTHDVKDWELQVSETGTDGWTTVASGVGVSGSDEKQTVNFDGAVSQFWRFYIPTRHSRYQAWVREVSFATFPPSGTSSSSEPETYVPLSTAPVAENGILSPILLDVNAEHKSGPYENVIDGSVDNYWNAGHIDGWDVPNWALFYFVAPQRVTGFSFYSYGDVTHDVKDWELQVSETGTDGWTTVASGVGVAGSDEKQTVNFEAVVSLFWRFYIPTRHSRYQAWVREVSFATFPPSGTSISSEPETYVPLSTAPVAENGILSPILLDVNAEHRSGPRENVIDGSVDNYWNAGHVDGWDVPNWALFYFVAPQRVTGFSFYSYGDVTHDVKDWELQVSETGTDGWTTVASGVGVSGSDEKQTTDIDGIVSQFWRFYIPTRHSRYQAWVREVSFATFPTSGTSISSEPETYVPLSTAPMAENGILSPILLDVNAEHRSGPRENVIDGSVGNYWNAGHIDGWEVPNWASFYFVAPQRVTGFSFYSYGDVTHDVKDWELQVSETGTDGWTTVASGVGVSGSDEKQTTDIDGIVSQFWRFYIPTRHSRYQAWVREVSFATFPPSGTSSSSEPETYVPLTMAPVPEKGILSPILLDVNAEHGSGPRENVIDGSVGNYWNAGHVDGWDVPNWASFYFVAPQRVTGFSFYSYGDVTHDVRDWELQVSETGTDGWTTVASGVGVSGSEDKQTVNFEAVVSQFWRFYIPTRHSRYQAWVREVAFTAAVAPSLPEHPDTDNTVRELLRIEVGLDFWLFDDEAFAVDLVAFLAGQVSSGKVRWTCPEDACVDGCPTTSAMKIAAGCMPCAPSTASTRSAQVLRSEGHVVVEVELSYRAGSSSEDVIAALRNEARYPTTLEKYNLGATEVVHSEVLHTEGGKDDDNEVMVILLISAAAAVLCVVSIILCVYMKHNTRGTDVVLSEANCEKQDGSIYFDDPVKPTA